MNTNFNDKKENWDTNENTKLSRLSWWVVLIIIAAGFYMVFTFSSCSIMRRSAKSTVQVHDTLKVAIHDTLVQVALSTDSIYVHDTIVTIPDATVIDTLAAAQLKPAYRAGRKIPQSYYASAQGITANITVDTAGNLVVSCHEDSLKIVIANLVRQVEQTRDSLKVAVGFHTVISNNSSSNTVITKKKSINWLLCLIVAAILIAGGDILYQKFKPPKL